jgi:hypothetical protein
MVDARLASILLLVPLAACGVASVSPVPSQSSSTPQALDLVTRAECAALKVGDNIAPFLRKHPHPYADSTGTLVEVGTERSITWRFDHNDIETPSCGVRTDTNGRITWVARLAG